MKVGKRYVVEVIRTKNIIELEVVGSVVGMYKIKFGASPAQWYRKGMFRGKDKIYKIIGEI